MADTTAAPGRRGRGWWIPAILAGLIIGVLLAGAGLAVTGHIDQDRYGWRWPAAIGVGALVTAILLVLAAVLRERRRAGVAVPAAAASDAGSTHDGYGAAAPAGTEPSAAQPSAAERGAAAPSAAQPDGAAPSVAPSGVAEPGDPEPGTAGTRPGHGDPTAEPAADGTGEAHWPAPGSPAVTSVAANLASTPGGRTVLGAAARDETVPVPRAQPVPVPEWAATDAGHPGDTTDERARLEAVRAKLADVVAAGRVGQPVPHTRQPARPTPPSGDPVGAEPRGVAVHGRVRAGAVPVAQAAVTLIDLGGRQVDKGSTGEDGGYRLAVPRPGTYTLIARARGHHPQASVVAVEDAPVELDLALAGTAGITGTVRIAGTTDGVPGAVVSLVDSSGAVLGAAVADADGAFRFGELIAGGYTLVGNAPGHRPVATTVTVPATGTATVELPLPGDARLVGVAHGGPDHRPLADALVTLLDRDGAVAGQCTTGPDGSYRFEGLPPGEYTVVASGYPAVSSPLHLSAGARQDHDIVLGHPAH